MSGPWLWTLGVALASAPDPGTVEYLRAAGTWQWYAVPLARTLPRGDTLLLSPCGDTYGQGVDPTALVGLDIDEHEALAGLYTQAGPATLLCLDPSLVGLQRACPAYVPDPTRTAQIASALEQSFMGVGSGTSALVPAPTRAICLGGGRATRMRFGCPRFFCSKLASTKGCRTTSDS